MTHYDVIHVYLSVLRRIMRIPQPTVSREEVLEIARNKCDKRSWPWDEPVHVQENLRDYWVFTNTHARGENVSITVDAFSGDVLHAGII